ncbi:uncharacterized protein LOC144442786 [Glandiceps talaboti]
MGMPSTTTNDPLQRKNVLTSVCFCVVVVGLSMWNYNQELNMARLQQQNRHLESRLDTIESLFNVDQVRENIEENGDENKKSELQFKSSGSHTDLKTDSLSGTKLSGTAGRSSIGNRKNVHRELDMNAADNIQTMGKRRMRNEWFDKRYTSDADGMLRQYTYNAWSKKRYARDISELDRSKTSKVKDRNMNRKQRSVDELGQLNSLYPIDNSMNLAPENQPIAAHLKAQNIGMRNLTEATFKYWDPPDWDTKGFVKYNRHTGCLQVQKAGLYYIYSQLFYDDEHQLLCGHETHVNDRAVIHSFSSMTENHQQTVNSFGVVRLNKGDEISINIPINQDSCQVYLRPVTSFFGVILLEQERSGGHVTQASYLGWG